MDDKKTALIFLGFLFLFCLGFSLFMNLPVKFNNFLFADQAVYFSMTQSIAHDGDLEWTKKDLHRYKETIISGPLGIFLKKGRDGRIFFAKSFAYSLFAAPFVRLFGINGHYVFHAFFLALVLYLGLAFLALDDRPLASLLGLLTFLFASVTCVYFLWISPDFFNFCLVFTILFLSLYKVRRKEVESVIEQAQGSSLRGFLLTGWSDYLAAFLAGVATFSKPPNIVLLGPLVLIPFLAKKYRRSILVLVFFFASVLVLFGANYWLTSDWNFMGGERKTFYFEYPLEKWNVTFDSTGQVMTSEGYFEKMLISPKFIPLNLFYYFFGRFTGLTWYFFPALLALVLFFLGRKKAWQWLIFAALTAEILIYITLMPTNYGGGGGSLANRYFLNIFPLFFFLSPKRLKSWHLGLSWAVAAIFISQILITPLQSSSSPASHAKRFPIKALPLEMTQVNEWPTNTNPNAFRVPVGRPPNEGLLHILDDNFHKKDDPEGMWTRGDSNAEMVLKTYFPLEKIIVRLRNNPRSHNQIRVTIDGMTQKIVLGSRQTATLEFSVGTGFKMKATYLHRLKIGAAKGAMPYYEDESSQERRNLGVFFSLELIPR